MFTFQSICKLEILLHLPVLLSSVLGQRLVQFFQNDFFTFLCRSENSSAFLIWLILSEMELEKCRTILHIRGQSSSLATRLHTQFHYIYKIPNTCLLLLNQSETRSRKSWELVTPSSQQSSNFAQATFKRFQRYKERFLSLSVNKFMFFYLLVELICLSVDNLMFPGTLHSLQF